MHVGDRRIFDRAIRVGRGVLALRSWRDLEGAMSCVELGIPRFTHTSDAALLREAIQLRWESLALRVPEHPCPRRHAAISRSRGALQVLGRRRAHRPCGPALQRAPLPAPYGRSGLRGVVRAASNRRFPAIAMRVGDRHWLSCKLALVLLFVGGASAFVYS
jgi:hypothetical protein